MQLIDTHIHLLAPEWQTPVTERIATAQAAGIGMLVQPGVRAADWQKLVKLASDHEAVYAAPGLHPRYAHEWNPAIAQQLGRLCRHRKVVALGEIGLDGLVEVDLKLQERVFRAQLEIARQMSLPVLLHCRKKIGLVFNILEQVGLAPCGGILHGFSGSLEMAQRAVGLGLLIGIGPVLLRANARKLPAAVQQVPAASLVLETDAPDMTDDPLTLMAVARKLAELRDWTLAETVRITTQNAARLLLRKEKIANE